MQDDNTVLDEANLVLKYNGQVCNGQVSMARFQWPDNQGYENIMAVYVQAAPGHRGHWRAHPSPHNMAPEKRFNHEVVGDDTPVEDPKRTKTAEAAKPKFVSKRERASS